MVTPPFVSAVVREAYSMIPFTYREAAYALGATRYEATRILLGYLRPAMVSGVILAFGRAIGETVAVSLVIGNTFNMTSKLFAPGYTISSLIANQFGNAFIYSYMTPVLFAAGARPVPYRTHREPARDTGPQEVGGECSALTAN